MPCITSVSDRPSKQVLAPNLNTGIEEEKRMSAYALVMFLAGLGIPVLAALSAALGRHLDAPFGASLILFGVALVSCLAVSTMQGGVSLAKVVEAPKHLFFAGCLVAFYIVSITYVAPRFGLGNAIFFVLLGQLLSAAVIDHFGLLNAPETRMNMLRVCGLLFMVAGVWLTQIATTK